MANQENNLKVYDHGARSENKIALTFDDGPNPFWTLKVLDILDRYGVKANFFVLGQWAERYPEILREAFGRGHLIGNHTYSHPRTGAGDFAEAEKIISGIIGASTGFIRPPYLSLELCRNYPPAMEGKAKIVSRDVSPADWENGAAAIEKIILSDTRNGSIILLHDGSRKEEEQEARPAEMFKALPAILEKLKRKFVFVRLDELDFAK